MMMKMVSKIVIPLIFLLSVLQSCDGHLMEYFCVADSQIPEEVLVTAMDWACGNGADCGPINGENGACYYPNTVINHASYAFNSYYHNMKYQGGSCYFNAAAIVTMNDPSHDCCKFEGSI